ncbi:hypothetical protein D3C75_904930 [compost metagenome]
MILILVLPGAALNNQNQIQIEVIQPDAKPLVRAVKRGPVTLEKRRRILKVPEVILHQHIPPQRTFPVNNRDDHTVFDKNIPIPQIPVD